MRSVSPLRSPRLARAAAVVSVSLVPACLGALPGPADHVETGGEALGSSAGSWSSSNSGSVSGGSGKFVGNITTKGAVRSDFAKYWNQITPENEGKWGAVEKTQGQYNWAALDAIHDYAKQQGIAFKQHNFVWGGQQPSWVGALPAAQQAAAVQKWIQEFCKRYPDTALIDVVNEPYHNPPTYANALGGAGASGYDWIVQAFKWAHQYCPSATLILNDYNIIEYEQDNTKIIDLVIKIKAAGAPINAVGAQAHAAYKLPTASVQGYLDKLATSTGLPVYVSEYDIDEADDSKQQSTMQEQFKMFYEDKNVKGITLWGYIGGATWKPNTGLITSSGTMRPAMTWLMKYLKRG